MPNKVDKEIEAIGAVLSALEPLSAQARASVIEYVMKRLEIPMVQPRSNPGPPDSSSGGRVSTPAPAAENHAPRLKDLKDEKNPRSANEMAALVAYFLSHVAPQTERKLTVTTKDIETHFKIGGYPLPEQTRATLQNAKRAGYFDLASDGGYKLNAVGYNLVVHEMPRGAAFGSGSKNGRAAQQSK